MAYAVVQQQQRGAQAHAVRRHDSTDQAVGRGRPAGNLQRSGRWQAGGDRLVAQGCGVMTAWHG